MTFIPLSQIGTTPLNYRGEVVFSTILFFIPQLALADRMLTSPEEWSQNLVFASGSERSQNIVFVLSSLHSSSFKQSPPFLREVKVPSSSFFFLQTNFVTEFINPTSKVLGLYFLAKSNPQQWPLVGEGLLQRSEFHKVLIWKWRQKISSRTLELAVYIC